MIQATQEPSFGHKAVKRHSFRDFIEHRPIDHNESKRRIFEDSANSGGQWRPDAYQVGDFLRRLRCCLHTYTPPTFLGPSG